MADSKLHRDRRPLPLQVRDQILAAIREDGLRPGDQIPSEPALSEQFQVARSTVREAEKQLERDGLIEVQHGRGSFVSAVADLGGERPITRFEGVTEMLQGLGYVVENEVLGVIERTATADERRSLGLGERAHVVELERLRRHEGQPFVYSRNVFARELIPGPLDKIDWSGSLLALLESHSEPITSSAAHIRAVDTPARLRELALDLPEMSWLLITEICVNSAGRPVLASEDLHRGDVFAFHFVRRRAEG
ncbi:MAG: GntR family transcriptional regulator [Solirubrobacteraceae bacterium]|nr:GntR family transcriptional regulator [Solirubrobacteraceae bacterium]